MEDHNGSLLDLSHAVPEIITIILSNLPLRERFTCALVCKGWAEAATGATHSIIIKHSVQNASSLRHWLKKHGNRLEVLQLHKYSRAALTALPCYAKLQDLLLHGSSGATIASRTWTNIASATRLTSVSVSYVGTTSQQADVVAALTALPNLEQLTWSYINCRGKRQLSDSSLLQRMMRLTSLKLEDVTAAALQHLGSLTKLQHLSISDPARSDGKGWAAAGCPGLQELKALTSLKLDSSDMEDIPASVSQLTALRQLDVSLASLAALNQLQVLTGLTQLCVRHIPCYLSPPLKLPGLQHLQLGEGVVVMSMPMSFLASCSQLQVLKLHGPDLEGPGSLVVSTMLQHLEIRKCNIVAPDDTDPVSWQQVFSCPGGLPFLTHLQLSTDQPDLQQPDIKRVVECCSSLKGLHLDALQDSFAPALARLPGLTNLRLSFATAEDYGALAQLTGLRQLTVGQPYDLSAVGLRQLALNQLTSLVFGCLHPSCDAVLDTLASHLMQDDLRDCQDDLSGYLYALINKAPSGSPPDVSSRLLDICIVVDACEGLSIEAVVEAAKRELEHSGSSGPSVGRGSQYLTAEALLAAAAALKAQGD